MNRSLLSTRRGYLCLIVVLATLDLVLKLIAVELLGSDHTVDLGILTLQVGYNSGVAFGLGASAPDIAIVAITATLTLGMLVFALLRMNTLRPIPRAALAIILGGAIANAIDRLLDGVVTDYFHTGWFPTFNMADVFITVGVTVLALSTVGSSPSYHGST